MCVEGEVMKESGRKITNLKWGSRPVRDERERERERERDEQEFVELQIKKLASVNFTDFLINTTTHSF